MNSIHNRSSETGYNFTKIWNQIRVKIGSRPKINSDNFVNNRLNRSLSVPVIKKSGKNDVIKCVGIERIPCKSLDITRSSCGNLIMSNGKVIDIILPYQRFMPVQRNNQILEIKNLIPVDIDISERGPMITKIKGPFVVTRERLSNSESLSEDIEISGRA